MFAIYAIISIILIVLCCRKGNCGSKKVKQMVIRIKGKGRKEEAKEEEPPNEQVDPRLVHSPERARLIIDDTY